MKLHKIFLIVMLSSFCYHIAKARDSITEVMVYPNAVACYQNDSVTLSWILNQDLDVKEVDYAFIQYMIPKKGKVICGWAIVGTRCTSEYVDRVTINWKTGVKNIILILANIQESDALYNYVLSIRNTKNGLFNSYPKAWLILYDVPDIAIGTSSNNLPDVEENTTLTMTCSTNSTTTFPDNLPSKDKPHIEYTWQRDNNNLTNDDRHSVSGNIVIIDKVEIQDDNITYRCIAQETGSRLRNSKDITLNVLFSARWYKLDPVARVNEVKIGTTANFKVWIIGRPLPRQDQWHWAFSTSNSSNDTTTNPENVRLLVSDDMAVLSITNVVISNYGYYFIWTNNQYGGWNEGELMFHLKQPESEERQPQTAAQMFVPGIIFGVVILCVVIIVVVLFVMKKKNTSKN